MGTLFPLFRSILVGFIFSFSFITELPDHLDAMGTSNKFREQPHKMLSDDKDMSNCFGFDVSLLKISEFEEKLV